MPNSPVIYGPNNTATNLQNQFLNANGSVLGYNGPKNYISNGSFENGTFTGWTLGAVTLSGVYPSGSAPIGGAIGTMSLGVTTSSPLSGTTSLSLSTTGNMAAQTCFFTNSLPIDAEDKAKVLTFKFSYSVISGAAGLNFSGTSTNSFAVAVYDATNSIYLGTAGQFNLTQNSGVGVCTGTFQTGSTTANIQFVVYCPNTTVAATPFTVNFDNFFVGPQTSPMAPAISDWLSYTPTITGFGTVTAVNFVSRRVGGNLEVKGAFAAGTNTATQAQITVGYQGGNANVVVDTTKTPASTIAGMGTINAAASNYFGLYVLVPSANQSYVNLGLQQTTTTAQTPINGNAVSGTGALIQVQFTVPIVGFSSNSSASSDTDTRVIAFTGTSASTAVSATVP